MRIPSIPLSLASIAIQVAASHSAQAETPATVAPIVAAPTSPAFDAIGATPTTIAHPTSIQSMGASLLSYVDQGGHVKAGVAMEAAPLWLLFGDKITLAAWRGSPADRALSRLTLSFASLEGSSGITNIAEGLRFVLWDDTDPRWDSGLEDCLVKVLTPHARTGKLPTDDSDVAVVADTGVKSCQDQARKRAMGSTAGAFSGAVTQQQDSTGNATFGKVYGWFSAFKTLGSGSRWLTLLGSARYVYNHPGHEMDIGLRVRAGGDDLGVSVDGAWTPVVDAGKNFRGHAGVVGVNGEMRVANGLWLTATAGGKFGADSGGAPDLFTVLHFKFATESSASIPPSGS